ncbi:MAG: class I SAM-dependent methyltransferase [Phycisphaerae bacterium]
MPDNGIYAEPRVVTDLDECFFYHSMDIPGHGFVQGEWDLRNDVDDYLGRVDFKGKRVLEIGTASGFLCMELEKRGAEVIAFDLSDQQLADIVPYAKADLEDHTRRSRVGIARINNSFWFNHGAHQSKAKVVYGTVYNMPEAIGPVDIVTFGSILPHLRDPFQALYQGCRFAKDTVIVTDVISRRYLPIFWLSRLGIAAKVFLPDYTKSEAMLSWWILTPEIIRRSIGVLGFEDVTTIYHTAPYKGKKARLFTVVGKRTCGSPLQG